VIHGEPEYSFVFFGSGFPEAAQPMIKFGLVGPEHYRPWHLAGVMKTFLYFLCILFKASCFAAKELKSLLAYFLLIMYTKLFRHIRGPEAAVICVSHWNSRTGWYR
jgi:hypothetical protein